MASKITLNAQNLEALGAGPLAELLGDVALGDATTKRRLRMELIGRDNPFKLATEILQTPQRDRGIRHLRRMAQSEGLAK